MISSMEVVGLDKMMELTIKAASGDDKWKHAKFAGVTMRCALGVSGPVEGCKWARNALESIELLKSEESGLKEDAERHELETIVFLLGQGWGGEGGIDFQYVPRESRIRF